jgi:hypothetical protein
LCFLLDSDEGCQAYEEESHLKRDAVVAVGKFVQLNKGVIRTAEEGVHSLLLVIEIVK